MFDVLLVLLLCSASAGAATRYVWQSSPSPAPPYTNWTTAAHVIQDAVDATLAGDAVLVAGGVYATGGRAVGTNLPVNRVTIGRAITVESLMGPEVTIIQGYQVPGTTNGDGAIRCVYLASGASLSGFTLTGGATRTNGDYYLDKSGGGVWCESTEAVVLNCVLVGNAAQYSGGGAFGGTLNYCTLTGNSAGSGGGASGGFLGGGGCVLNNCTLTGNSAGSGGGAYFSALKNCLLTGNRAYDDGGGTVGGWLTNCTLIRNSAGRYGGGASGFEFFLGVTPSTLVNCILYYNTAPVGANYPGKDLYGEIECLLNHCCTTPLPDPSQSVANIAAEPQLLGASHLSATSPCRGAGSAEAASGTDLDGEPPAFGLRSEIQQRGCFRHGP